MKPALKIILLLFIFQNATAQNFTKNKNYCLQIDNDQYSMTIEERSELDMWGEQSGIDNKKTSYHMKNVSLSRAFHFMYYNAKLKIDESLKYKGFNIDFKSKNQSLTLDEERKIMTKNIATCLGVKYNVSTIKGEKWILELKDSTLLTNAIHKGKLDTMEDYKNSWYSDYKDNIWEVRAYSLGFSMSCLSRNLEIPIENKIQSEALYDFKLEIPAPISSESIKKQFEKYGITMRIEQIEQPFIVIE